MLITWDPAKRERALRERHLDFADALDVFKGPTLQTPDRRFDYGEPRIKTLGLLQGRVLMIVWTPRGSARRIISMRKANDREKAAFGQRFDQG
jgi:uncharacterized DUF497 family protein